MVRESTETCPTDRRTVRKIERKEGKKTSVLQGGVD